jgi:outer membrane lipoprotein-sorting protein
MKKNHSIVTIALLIFYSSSFAQGQIKGQISVDEIIAQNIAAIGGAEKWDGINTLTMRGKMVMGPMEFPFRMIQKRPNKIYTVFEVQGMKGKQAFDGSVGWSLMPFTGKTKAELMASDQLKVFKKQADIDGPLRDYKEKGNTIEYIGETQIDGVVALEIKLTEKEGDINHMFFDKEKMLLIKVKSKVEVMDQWIESETTISNYKKVDGLFFPHSIKTHMGGIVETGGLGEQEILIRVIEINKEVDDSLFTMPIVLKPVQVAQPADQK